MSIEITDRQELARAMRAARKADQDALSDPTSLARYLDPGFVVRAHTRVIGQHLGSVARGEVSRLLITLPPQIGKSVLAAMWAPFWWLARHPEHRVIIASYGQQLAITRGRAVRRMVLEHGWRYGLHLERGSAAVHEWLLKTGGGVKAVGAGSAVTGSPGDAIICDDLVKGRAEAESVQQRDKISDWWSADLLSRLAPRAPVIMLSTLWHWDDQYARVVEQDGREEDGGMWRVVRIPAFADVADDPLGREIGDPLPHPKLANDDYEGAREHWENKRQQARVRDWHALYMCNPQPSEGALVSAALLRARRHRPPQATPVKHGVAVDPSGGGRDIAGIIGGFLGDDGRLYLTHDYSVNGPSELWGREASILAAETGADFIAVEKNYGGDMARVVLRSAWDTVQRLAKGETRPEDDGDTIARCEGLTPGIMPQLRQPHAKKGKLLRAEPIAQQWADDRLRTGAYLPEMEYEWSSWQPTDPDSPGRIDAACYLAYALLPIPGAQTLVSTVAGTSQDQVTSPAAVGAGRPRIQRQGY